MNIESIRDYIRSSPEVTKAEALSKGLLIADMAQAGDEAATASLCEIVGFAAVCDCSESVRKVISLQRELGTFDKWPL